MTQFQQFMNSRNVMFQFLLYVLLFSYFYNILSNLFRLFQMWKGILRLIFFIASYEKVRCRRWARKLLLSYYPIISRYTYLLSESLRYDDDYYALHQKSIKLLADLLQKKDFQRHQFHSSFNPIQGIKTFFKFPVVVLSWFGIKPNRKHEPTINIVGIALEVFLSKMLENHYAELESLVKSVPDIIRNILSNIL